MPESGPRAIIEPLNPPAEPFDLFKKIRNYPYAFFLDSSSPGERLGRFSFIGADPFLVFRSRKEAVTLEWRDASPERFRSDPFLALKGILDQYNNPDASPDTPFISGGAGYFSYDLKDFIETLPDIAEEDMWLPDCMMAFYDIVVSFDHLLGRAFIASSGLSRGNKVVDEKAAQSRLKEFKDRISSFPVPRPAPALPAETQLKSNFSRDSYKAAILKAKEYIKKGDIYQVNLSQRFETPLTMEPIELYSRLRHLSPAPFSAYLDFGGLAILSSSPERFLRKSGSYIETRPIKGTRPRGGDPLRDKMLEEELLNSTKDRAEHVMIVDLERNDLGRICDYGSVSQTEAMALEKYPGVFHLVSTVAGHLKEGTGPVDCLVNAFPGGSITGAPKIRSMEIIEELEPVKRSIYTGAIGYISFNGNMDTSIVIRTLIIKDGKVFFSVGGGIVADSDPDEEYEETLHKARGLMRALGADHGKNMDK